jgi:hypothetical protein
MIQKNLLLLFPHPYPYPPFPSPSPQVLQLVQHLLVAKPTDCYLVLILHVDSSCCFAQDNLECASRIDPHTFCGTGTPADLQSSKPCITSIHPPDHFHQPLGLYPIHYLLFKYLSSLFVVTPLIISPHSDCVSVLYILACCHHHHHQAS